MPSTPNEIVLCKCGCGNPAPIVQSGCFKGMPCHYISGHNLRYAARNNLGHGATHPNWKGGRIIQNGYAFVKRMGHPRAHKQTGYLLEQIEVAERALGRPLPPQAVVHHVNEVKSDNRNENLVICEDRAYHNLLHQRLRAYQATGNPEHRKCWVCKQYDDVSRLRLYGTTAVHPACGKARKCGR